MNNHRCRDLKAGEEIITTGATLVWNNDGTWTVVKFHDKEEPSHLTSDESSKVHLNGNGIPYVEQSIESGEFYDPMYPNFLECHADHVVLMADDMFTGDPTEHTITVEDMKSFGNSGSGMSCLGSIMGDHRMIMQIYEDVLEFFQREHPELFSSAERAIWLESQ